MNENILVSVIIPMYNAEEYIRPCLESVLSQSMRSFEILAIDDASKDGSVTVAEETLLKSDALYQVITNSENHGPSYVRNLGIKSAKGKYVFFLDSDDILAENALEVLVEAAEKDQLPVVYGLHKRFFSESEQEELVKQIEDEKESCVKTEWIDVSKNVEHCLFSNAMIWGGVYKRDFLEKKALFFDEAICWGEDAVFRLHLLKYISVFPTVNRILYWWRITPNSISRTKGMVMLAREALQLEKVYTLIMEERNTQTREWLGMVVRFIRIRKNSIYGQCAKWNIHANSILKSSFRLPVGIVLKCKMKSQYKLAEILYSLIPVLDSYKVQKWGHKLRNKLLFLRRKTHLNQ